MKEAEIRKLHLAHLEHCGDKALEYPSFRARLNKWWNEEKAVHTPKQFERFVKDHEPVLNTKNLPTFKNPTVVTILWKKYLSEEEVTKIVKEKKKQHVFEFLKGVFESNPNELVVSDWNRTKTFIAEDQVDKIMMDSNEWIDRMNKRIMNEKPEMIFFADPTNSGDKPMPYYSKEYSEKLQSLIKKQYFLSFADKFVTAFIGAVAWFMITAAIYSHIIAK